MARPDVSALEQIYQQTAHAHHQAFIEVDGADPEWPSWYAEQLAPVLNEQLGTQLTKSEVVVLLLELDQEHQARDGEPPWPRFYAEQTLQRYGAVEGETLALYHFDSCPFCRMVRSTIVRLGVEIELRDIYRDPSRLDELVAARGRPTVPVLQCTSPDGIVRWMPESRDIIRYLEERYGK